jgi:CHRD domain
MNLRARLAIGVAVFVVAVAGVTVAVARDGGDDFDERLKGFEEVPAVSTTGEGKVRLDIKGHGDSGSIKYRLSYEDLEGPVTQAHIHLGQRHTNGSIVVFFCTNLTNPPSPPGTQACPPSPATVEGTLTAADVTNLAAGQGIAQGEFAEFVRALRAGVTYANVHSGKFPGGEIRGQLDDQRR